MKFGLYGLHKGTSASPEALARRAKRAEEIGFESQWIGDHIALPADAPDPAQEPRLELITALAHLAGVTSRVRLASGVAVLPQRHPVLLAKQLASVDVLSNGRLIVGVGAGYVEQELKALGASLADRGARTDEFLAAIQALWGEETPEFTGRFVSFADVIQRPRPMQRPRPPIVCGGHSPPALRRAAERADGWYGWDLSPEQAAIVLDDLREAERRCRRPARLRPLEVTITPPDGIDAATVDRYSELGVDRLVVQPSTSDGVEIDDLIKHVGRTFMPAAGGASS